MTNWQQARDDFQSWTSGRIAAVFGMPEQRDGRAKSTTPLRGNGSNYQERTTPRPERVSDGYQSISPSATVWLVNPCPECAGSGFSDMRPACRRCGKSWRLDTLASGVRNDWRGRWRYLPCGHNAMKDLIYRDPFCKTCKGSGGFGFHATMRNLADVVAHVLNNLHRQGHDRQLYQR